MNMHYCRFRNTRRDLQECLMAIAEGERLDWEEHRAAENMLMDTIEFLQDMGISETYDRDELDKLMKEAEPSE